MGNCCSNRESPNNELIHVAPEEEEVNKLSTTNKASVLRTALVGDSDKPETNGTKRNFRKSKTATESPQVLDGADTGTMPDTGDSMAVNEEVVAQKNLKREELAKAKGAAKFRAKDEETQTFIKEAVMKDHICHLLDQHEVDFIINTMEYFEFDPEQDVVKQGDYGCFFYLIHEGEVEVKVNGSMVKTIHQGTTFGGEALLYNCPRTATLTTKTKCGLWGIACENFQEVLRKHAEKHRFDNRVTVDAIKLFQELPDEDKDHIATAVFGESYAAGERVITEGDGATGLYFVKSGTLQVVKGATVVDGALTGGEEIGKLGPGDVFGEKAFIKEHARDSSVVALDECELCCISAAKLKELLGMDLRTCLDRHWILAAMHLSPIFTHFRLRQQGLILQVMQLKELEAYSKLFEEPVLLCVVEGQVSVTMPEGASVLSQGEFYEHGWDGCAGAYPVIVAGSSGARVGILTADGVMAALDRLRVPGITDKKRGMDLFPKVGLLNKVRIFRHLPQHQFGSMIQALELRTFHKGSQLMKQGDVGTIFFFVDTGQVMVLINGVESKMLQRNDFYGERALLLAEPQNATIEVHSGEASVWCVERAVAEQFMSVKMLNELTCRIALYDSKVELKDLKHVQIIGEGGFGIVRLVECIKTAATYSLKRIRKVHHQTPEDAKREYNLLSDIDHPFIVHIVRTFEATSSIYILSEILMGGSLRQAMMKINRPFSADQARLYVGCLVLALECLADHNIVYRDLTPENVIFDMQGYVKLIDFGVAKKFRRRRGRTFTMCGSPHYMAPELLRGRGYGIEVDLWSLGVILFEIMCFKLPLGNDTDDPSSICAEIIKAQLSFPKSFMHDAARYLVKGLMAVEPGARPGAGADGFNILKDEEFFRVDEEPASVFFDKVFTRAVEAPYLPDGEVFAEPYGAENMVLSDAEELAPCHLPINEDVDSANPREDYSQLGY